MTSRKSLIPLVVAAPMFLQNVDMMATTVALPDMARTLDVRPLELNLVIAAYAISLAVFLPVSAWLVSRFGAKRMFCLAIVVFAAASALCGMAPSATVLVIFRVVQGFGAALMVPVGRLILLRSVPANELMAAMVWFTIPPAIGRLLGPLIGGAIVSVASWRWIFLVNIPLGLVAVLIALMILPRDEPGAAPEPFDIPGFALMGLGLGALLGGIEAASRGMSGHWIPMTAIVGGTCALLLYGIHSLRIATPIVDLRILRFGTFRMNVLGAVPLRLANAASPFLVPLMLQFGFGMKPLQAGFVASGVAAGSLGTRLVMRQAMRRISFRTLFIFASALTATFLVVYGTLTASMPDWLLFLVFFMGGMVTSLCLVSLNTVGFVDVPKERTAHATALVAMAQQTCSALGVVSAAALLGIFADARGGSSDSLAATDFSWTFMTLGLVAAISIVPFSRLRAGDGDALREREARDDD